jgi:hypothetical protein
MTAERVPAFARRVLVVSAVVVAIAVAFVTVEAAAQWRATAAVFEPAPADAGSIVDAAGSEAQRAADLRGQLGGVARQLSDLQAALIAGTSGINADSASAAGTRDQLARAQARLHTLQRQLKQAQERLTALNRAASRQAALNAGAALRGPGARAAGASAGGEVEQGD